MTPEQSRALKQLSDGRRSWPRRRWWILGIGLLTFIVALILPRCAASLFLHATAGPVTQLDVLNMGLFEFFAVQSLLLGLYGLYLIIRALMHWRGRPEDILLLYLLEEERSESSKAP